MLHRLGVSLPLFQAPMAGVSTPALAAAVCQAGGLGALGLGAATVAQAQIQIAELQAKTEKPFNLNFFVHAPAVQNTALEHAWCKAFEPLFAQFGAQPPTPLREIYTSLHQDEAMQRLLLTVRPAVASFHFGVPPQALVRALKAAGVFLVATATCVEEAKLLEKAGMDALIAQGIEAGGHRGIFETTQPDTALSTMVLTQLLHKTCQIPIIAAGGIMTGYAIAAALKVGATAAQLGTAFIGCPESAANAAYRTALTGPGAFKTEMVTALSGRLARSLPNKFTAFAQTLAGQACPAYPLAYDMAKALNTAAQNQGEYGFAAQWAGQGAPLARSLPAASLMASLKAELESAL